MRTNRALVFLLLLFVLSACVAERTIVLPNDFGKSYGFVWFHDDVAQELMLGDADTYFPINFSDGCTELNMDCDSWNVSVTLNATYMLDYHTSFSDGANREFHVTVGVNGVEENEKCHSARKIGTGGDIGSMSGNCLLPLVTGDIISLMVENEGAATPIFIKDFSFSVVKI